MGSDDFIDLDPVSDSDHQEEENGLHKVDSIPSEADCRTSTSHLKEDIPDGENIIDAFGENGDKGEGQYVVDMDLEDDSIQEQTIIEQRIELVDSVVMEEKLNVVRLEKANDNGCAPTVSDTTANNDLIDESPIAGVKRARMAYVDQQPSVHVVYNYLTRESKNKLMELMQQWSEWHAQCNSSSTVSSNEALECGEETYFPALHVGSEKTSTVPFWVDNQVRKEEFKSMQLESDLVPLYDREYTLGSSSLGGSAIPDRIETLDASRCFNCGSYSHALKECSKPRDNVAINNARKQHTSKRNPAPGSRGQVRYYQKTAGKFDDLKAGVLGPETRESLGIGEFDPPPWLHRMRELGYPPGYLDAVEDEDQPSGITIFADEEAKEEYEDGELPEKGEPVPPEKKMTVEFPGINAPIPENADHRRWAAAAAPSGSFRSRSQSHYRDSHRGYSESHRGHSTEHLRIDAPPPPPPPGTDYGQGSGSGSAMPNYSPRYSHYDHSNPSLVSRSPSLGRSLSDRGWRSPAGYENSQQVQSPLSSYPYPSGARQSPSHQYSSSPSATLDRWAPENAYGVNSEQQIARDRHEHQRHRHHHRN